MRRGLGGRRPPTNLPPLTRLRLLRPPRRQKLRVRPRLRRGRRRRVPHRAFHPRWMRPQDAD
eukprot:6392826-Alexandrium_andersonii.AAC.1